MSHTPDYLFVSIADYQYSRKGGFGEWGGNGRLPPLHHAPNSVLYSPTEMRIFKNIHELNAYFNLDSRHPLIDIRRFADVRAVAEIKREPAIFDFYTISFIRNFDGVMQQGNTTFDSTNGVLYFITPGQAYRCTSSQPWEGYQILIHPDIFKTYLVEKNIGAYSFFSYDADESLLLTAEEERSIEFLMNESWNELNSKKDDFSIPIVLSFISILLNSAERFYLRQFETRKTVCNQLTHDFFALLKAYYGEADGAVGQPEAARPAIVQPSVSLFSEKLHITPNYLSDVVRHHTGKPALTIIHEYIVERAKMLLKTSNKSVSEIATMLGFEYPNYFSRLFKKKTAVSPSEFRKSVKRI